MRRLLFFPLVFASCSTATEPSTTGEFPGKLEHYGDRARISVPDSVRAGDLVEVSIETIGGTENSLSGPLCLSAGDTRVEHKANVIEIILIDEGVPIPRGAACVDQLTYLPHIFSLNFDVVGEVALDIVGRRVPGNERVTLRHTIHVLPDSSG